MTMTMRLMTLAVLCGLSGLAMAKDDPAAAQAKAEIRKTIQGCAQGLERVIPGDYYFCAAARDISRGHDSLGRERLRDAAFWASKPAQYVLGLMYFNGDEGPVDRPQGIAWLALAAERHDKRFEPAFVEAYSRATPEERAKANELWLQMRNEYADPVAGQRAQRRYLAEMRNIEAATMFGGEIYVDGVTPPDAPGTGEFGSGEGNRFGSQHDFALVKKVQQTADEYFRGMVGTVTVGQEQLTLVPLGTVVDHPAPGSAD
jgi:hypothetical protein